MAEGDPLGPDSSFGILCSQTRLSRTSGKAAPSAFKLKDGHDYVSGGWLELCSSTTQPEQIKEFCRQIKEIGWTVTENYKVAVLAVGDTISTINSLFGQTLKFIHHPDTYDCHSGMHGTDHLGVLVEEELSELADTAPVVLD